MKTAPKIHFFLVIINVIYAVSYIVAKEIMPIYIGPLAMMFFRALGAVLFFTILHKLFYYENVEPRDLLKIAGCAVFGIAINGMLFLKGIALTVPINASLIMILTPILVMIISYLFLKEKIGWQKSLGAIIGLLGAYILITQFKPLQFSSATFQGDMFILTNATSFSIYLVLVREMLRKYNAVTMARWLFTAGLVMIIPFAFSELKELSFTAFELPQYLAFGYMIIFPTCIAYLLYNISLQKVAATVASSYIFVQPLVTAILAIFLGKDHLNSYKVTGGIAICLGVGIVLSANANKKVNARSIEK